MTCDSTHSAEGELKSSSARKYHSGRNARYRMCQNQNCSMSDTNPPHNQTRSTKNDNRRSFRGSRRT